MVELLYLILLLISIIFLINYIKKDDYLLGTVFFAVFIFYYILLPSILGIYDKAVWAGVKNAPHLVVYVNSSEGDKLRALLITALTTALLIALRNVRFTLRKKQIDNNVIHASSVVKYDFDYLDRNIYIAGIVFLIIGGVALFEISFELGGFERMMSLGSTIRGYRTNNEDYLSSIGAICKTLSVFVTGSFFCFYASSPKHRRHRLYVIVSLILSVIYMLFNAGRAPIILFFACVMFAIIKEWGKKVEWMVVLGMIFLFFVSSSLEVVLNNISHGLPIFYNIEYSFSDNLLATISNLTYSYANVLELPNMIAKSGYQYGLDYIFWFSEIIPKRLLGFFWNLFPARTLVTTKVSQYYIQSGLSIGGTPADFITYGWFQGSFIGLIINCIIYDTLLKTFNDRLKILPKQYSIIKYRMCFFAYSLITSNDLPVVLKSNLFLIVMMFVIEKSLKKCERKNEL